MAHLAYQAIKFFEETVTAFDAAWVYDAGENTLITDPDYTFKGVVQPAADAALESLPEGQRAAVSLMLHTQRALKIAAPGREVQNTYIRYQGQVLKVVALGLWQERSFFRYGLQSVESMAGR